MEWDNYNTYWLSLFNKVLRYSYLYVESKAWRDSIDLFLICTLLSNFRRCYVIQIRKCSKIFPIAMSSDCIPYSSSCTWEDGNYFKCAQLIFSASICFSLFPPTLCLYISICTWEWMAFGVSASGEIPAKQLQGPISVLDPNNELIT